MENKITISSLASSLAQTTGKTKKLCEDFLKEFFRLASESLEAGEPLRVKGFGSFKIVEVESRVGVNVNTGERQEIQPYKKVVFTPSKEMAAIINAPFEEFEAVELEDDFKEEYWDDPEEEPLSEEELLKEEEPQNDLNQNASEGNEDKIEEYRLEEGSEEEGEDDALTYEAYQDIEKEKTDIVSANSEEEAEKVDSPGDNVIYGLPGDEEREITGNKENKEEEETPVVLPVYEEFETESKSRFGMGFLVGSLSTFAVCAVIFMLGCFLDWWPVSFGKPSEMKEIAVQEIPVETQVEEEPSPQEIMAEPVYDTVSTTRYLTTIARAHYGNFNFWPYIYMENESILGHPDRITPGTKVVVPELSKYGVDPKNPQDIATAKAKAIEIYARFK